MKNQQLSNNLTALLLLDEQMRFTEINPFDSQIFFDVCPVLGQTPAEAVGEANASEIMQALERARHGRRNTCFEYCSKSALESIYVGGYVEYNANGSLALMLGSLENSSANMSALGADLGSAAMLKAIFQHLPIGLEIYDRDGLLLEMNEYEMRALGIVDKQQVLGINLFENPNLPYAVQVELKAGVNQTLALEYDFGLLDEYFGTTKRDIRQLEVSISVMHNAVGMIDKYLVISQDVTDRVQIQRKYENLYKQNITILNTLPISVGLYSSDGHIKYANQSLCTLLGASMELLIETHVSIFQNPFIPLSVKDAIRNGESVHLILPYDFSEIKNSGYFQTSQRGVRQIESYGEPIYDADGKYGDYVFILSDVTESTRHEAELRQSKRKAEIAMQASEIMLWEFDAREQVFFSDNEPMNGYDQVAPIPIALYNSTMHEEDLPKLLEAIKNMIAGVDESFKFDARVLFPGNPEWQYCSFSGSPFEKDQAGRVVKYVGSRKNNTDGVRRKMFQDKILNSIPVPIHIKDVEDNFRYVFCNDESKRLFNTSEQKTIADVMDVHEVDRVQRSDLDVFKTGEPYFGQERIVLRDGRSYDTIVRKSIIYDGNKRLLLNVRWDQSLLNDLQRRAKVLSITMESMEAYMWVFEPGINKVTFGEGFDKACENPAQIESLEAFAACIHPDDQHLFLDSINERLQFESGDWKVVYRADLNDDGIYEWWETRGVLETSIVNDEPYKYMFGMSICIDKYKRTELALLNSKEELAASNLQTELVLNNTNSGLAFITRDYVVQWENISKSTASLSYEAYKRGELCYKSAHGRTSPCENCVMTRAIESRQLEQIKFTLDDDHSVEVFAMPVIDAEDAVMGVVIRMDDVTSRERMIYELKQAKAQAEQSDKLKSAFLANMSHEIRTPLNAIVGFSELLTTSDGEEREEYIRIINDNNELLLKLINDILDLSKIEAGSVELVYEEFDLSDYFEGMVSTMRQRVKNPSVQLTSVNPYSTCLVRLDRNRIAQILTNYVTNAIKYTPRGVIEMGYAYINEHIQFYVKDTGIGIGEEKKEKVFHRFEKLDEFAQGTGLGLSICKAICESMGGNVGFESTLNQGSTFWAQLPCEAEITYTDQVRTIDPEGGEEPQAQVWSRALAEVNDVSLQKTILVAEDIMSNYLLLRAMLKKNFNLIHAINGLQAIEMVRANDVDLVLMDMKMPVMNGMESTTEIRKFNTELPIVALTAHAFESDRVAALAAGCSDYLVKPVDKLKLMATFRKYGLLPSSDEVLK